MRNHQLQTQCARALRSAIHTTSRPSKPSANRMQYLPRALPSYRRPFHSSHSCLKKSSLFSKTKSSSSSSSSSSPKDIDAAPAGTNFSELDVLGSAPVPSTSVDVCMHDGFGLNSGVTIKNGDGALLVSGEAFSWRPWEIIGEKKLVNAKGQFEIPIQAFGVLDVLWPRPDLLIIGAGREIRPLSPATKKGLADMGLRVDILDTRNAAAQFNLLATERGVGDVAAALIPIGWEEGVGAA